MCTFYYVIPKVKSIVWLGLLHYIMSEQTGLDWSKLEAYSTWKKKSRMAGWFLGERAFSMAMPSCRHSACSCWNSTSETYCLSRSLVMFTHSWNAQSTHTPACKHSSARMAEVHQRDAAECLCLKNKNAQKQCWTQSAVRGINELTSLVTADQ